MAHGRHGSTVVLSVPTSHRRPGPGGFEWVWNKDPGPGRAVLTAHWSSKTRASVQKWVSFGE